MTAVYDAGVLIAAEASVRSVWAEHRVRLDMGVLPVTTAPVVAQVSRSARQVQLRRFLRGCRVRPFEDGQSHRVGGLLAATATSDVVDAHVAVVTFESNADLVITSDPDDLSALLTAAGSPARVAAVE